MSNGQDNLIPLNKRSKDEQRRIQALGGKASGKSRKRRKALKKTLETIMSMELSAELEERIDQMVKSPLKDKTVQDAVVAGIISRVIERGDAQSFLAIRDMLGENDNDFDGDGVNIIDDIPIK